MKVQAGPRRRFFLALAAIIFPACGVIGIPSSGSPPESEVRIAIRQASSLDPVYLNDPGSMLAGRQLFEPLVTFDPSTLRLRQGVASSWEVLDGGSRFVFHLRPQAKFHDGLPVSAADVVFSLNRLARRETGAGVGFLLDQVLGFEAVNKTGDAQDLEGLRAIDGSTVEIRLKSPWYDFPYVLTSPATAPVPQSEITADPARFARAPVGTGPYRLEEPVERGADFSLQRSDVYWGPRPSISKVTFLLYDQNESSWKDFQSGLIDIAEAPSGSIDAARAKYGSAGFSPVAASVLLGFNLSKVPDIRIRRAVSLAIDRRSIAHQIYDDVLVPATGMVPPGLGVPPGACASDCGHDPAAASALVREAYPSGAQPVIGFDFQGGSPQDELAKAIQEDLAGAGLAIDPRPVDLPGLFDRLDQGQQEMFRLGWAADYPLADWFLTRLFRSDSDDNYTGLADPEIDGLIAKARSEPDPERRLRLYSALEKREMETLSILPVGYFRNRYVASEHVKGFYADRLGGFQLSRMRIEP